MLSFLRTPRLTVRAARAEDAAGLQRAFASYVRLIELPGRDPGAVAAALSLFPPVDSPAFAGRAFVANDGEAAGAAAWAALDALKTAEGLVDERGNPVRLIGDGQIAVVRVLFIAPWRSFSQVAAPLLAATEADAAAAGLRDADVIVGFGPAPVFRALGYRPIGQLAIGSADGDGPLPLLRMRKPIGTARLAA